MADTENDVFPSSASSSSASPKKTKDCSSYTYWVRKKTGDAAPDPVPRKLSSQDIAVATASASVPLGSAWNQVCFVSSPPHISFSFFFLPSHIIVLIFFFFPSIYLFIIIYLFSGDVCCFLMPGLVIYILEILFF